MHVVEEAKSWDERRNTSGNRRVEPGALPAALAALARLHDTDRALYEWIADGYQRLTEAEHVARFGAPYGKKARPGH